MLILWSLVMCQSSDGIRGSCPLNNLSNVRMTIELRENFVNRAYSAIKVCFVIVFPCMKFHVFQSSYLCKCEIE